MSIECTPLGRNVALLLDETYVNGKIEYKKQSISGFAFNDPKEVARTVQTFMISSVFGPLKEVVRLLPSKNIDAPELLKVLTDVIVFIQNNGFKVICLVTDNNRINQRLFKFEF